MEWSLLKAVQMAQYVDNEELYNEVVVWKKQLEQDPSSRMPDSIGLAIMTIAHNFTNHWRFIRYTDDWKELMVGDAIETCVKYLNRFDTEKYKNPHAYITMICARCFLARVDIEKEKDAAKYRFFIENVFDADDEEMAAMVDVDFYSDMMKKVNDYENSRKRNNSKKRKKPTTDALQWMEDES